MKSEHKIISIGEIYDGYINNEEEGVYAYNGLLNIRPAYQREYIYDDKKRNAVVDTVTKGLPLGIFHWANIIKEDGSKGVEVIDGQQRLVSICEFVDGNYSIDGRYFHTLPEDERDQILNYKLDVFVYDGTPGEKLAWFTTINIANMQQNAQELRNAVWESPWTTDARRYFAKTGCPAFRLAKDYMKGSPIRQDYLETVLSWAGDKEGRDIEDYMGFHSKEKDAHKLWQYFREVIDWVQKIYPYYRKEMKGVPWGILYNQFGDREDLDPEDLEKQVKELMMDRDVTKKAGIYDYLLSGDETKLSIRAFSDIDRREVYEKQNGRCAVCGKKIDFDNSHCDHVIPWSKGGKTVIENCQVLCRDCNLKKKADL